MNRSRSSVTVAGASRHTTSITTGLASAVDAAPSAGGHSHSFHCSLCPYTHYSPPARCQALQRRFAEQCSREKALPKLKDSNRLPDPAAVRRWVKWAGLFPVGSFLSQPDRYSCGPLAGSRASVCWPCGATGVDNSAIAPPLAFASLGKILSPTILAWNWWRHPPTLGSGRRKSVVGKDVEELKRPLPLLGYLRQQWFGPLSSLRRKIPRLPEFPWSSCSSASSR